MKNIISQNANSQELLIFLADIANIQLNYQFSTTSQWRIFVCHFQQFKRCYGITIPQEMVICATDIKMFADLLSLHLITFLVFLFHMKTFFLPHSVKRSTLKWENKNQCAQATNHNLLWELDSKQFSHHAPPPKHSQQSDTGKKSREKKKKKEKEKELNSAYNICSSWGSGCLCNFMVTCRPNLPWQGSFMKQYSCHCSVSHKSGKK